MSQCFHWKQVPPAEFAVIGSPISHSLSPLMQNAALQVLGINKRYVAIEVEPESFQEAMHQLVALGFEGINVTIPHKTAAFEWCQSHSEVAHDLGVVNTIRVSDRFGWNTDAPGFMASLKGDCDTRTILLFSILTNFNYDVMVLGSYTYKHSILAINLRGNGAYKFYNNKKYFVWETTMENMEIGQLPSEISDMNLWNINLQNINN